MAPRDIEAEEAPIAKLFSRDYEEADALLSDLLACVDETVEDVSELSAYFLGSIVLAKEGSHDFKVIDGQQRLTTLAILISAVRALADPELAQSLTQRLYEPKDVAAGTPNRFRLSIRPRDNDFFRTYVLEEAGLERLEKSKDVLPDSQQRIRENATLFMRRLRAESDKRRVALAKFVVQRCFMVAVTTPDPDSAYRIFSVLNDRGLDLYHSDILKAEIIGKLPPSLEDEYTRKWEDAEEALGREAFRDLFGHIRMIARKTKPKDTVLKEIRQYLAPERIPRDFVDTTLVPMARAYRIVLKCNYEAIENAKAVNTMLRWLAQIDNVDWHPAAILYFARHQAPERILRFVTELERLAAALMVRRIGINERIERYGRLLAAVECGDEFSEGSPLTLDADERRQFIERLDGDVYPVEKTRRMILLRVDAALSAGGAEYEHKLVTIEHVLPQTPKDGSQWLSWWPDVELRHRMVHRLGNLALLDGAKNSQASNWDFERKKKEYFARRGVSPFQLTTQVLNENTWTPDVVERRQGELVDVLSSVWRLDSDTQMQRHAV